jgi:lysozyme family protein
MTPFDIALAFTLKHEGGYVVDKRPHGGPTNYGIKQSTYNAWLYEKSLPFQDVKTIPMGDVRSIYYSKYWIPAGCDTMTLDQAIAVFDFAVNSGVSRAVRYLGLSQGTEDYLNKREFFLKNLHDPANEKGWINRVEDLRRYIKDVQA